MKQSAQKSGFFQVDLYDWVLQFEMKLVPLHNTITFIILDNYLESISSILW